MIMVKVKIQLDMDKKTPPQYNITNINVNRLALFTGTNDALADPRDVIKLLNELNP